MVWPQLRHLRWLLQMYQCLGEAHGVTITHSPSDVGIDFFFPSQTKEQPSGFYQLQLLF